MHLMTFFPNVSMSLIPAVVSLAQHTDNIQKTANLACSTLSL